MTQEVLGLPRQEVSNRLKNGDIAFILEAELPKGYSDALARLEALIQVHPEAPFYAGLLTENSSQKNKTLSAFLFALALKSSSPPVRREAAEKLILFCLETEDTAFVREALFLAKGSSGAALCLRAACLYRIGRFGDIPRIQEEVPFGKIIPLLAAWNYNRGRSGKAADLKKISLEKEIKAFFFDNPLNGSPSDLSAWEWALAEIKRLEPDFFGPGENAILSGREAVAGSAYGRGVRFFRQVLEDSLLYPPEQYFFPYSGLITDLGRAYQFTPQVQDEGAALFDTWIKTDGANPGVYYRLLYFAGRIERQRQKYQASSARFMEAVRAAPDEAQKDACIWYIMMNTLAGSPDSAASLAKEMIPHMSSPLVFLDILERLSQQLVKTGEWNTMLEIFEMLKSRHHAAAAQYAWILGRAVQEGRLETNRAAEDFFKIAYEEGNAFVYYRAMSAYKLKVPLIPVKASGKQQRKEKLPRLKKQESKFIMDFFEFNTGSLVLPYIKKIENDVPVSELRKIARALGENGLRGESLSLIARYMTRENYELSSEDMHLFYPRHFREIIEANAEKAAIGPEILFGLIRTESAFMPEAVSRSNATGLGQVMQATGLEMAGRIARQEGIDYRENGQVDLKNTGINVHISAYYLSYLIEELGNPMAAFLAYNGGIGRVRRWKSANSAGADLPDDLFLESLEFSETREYGRRVLAAAAMYGWLYYGMSMEAVAADIYR
jgi:soluble lytic murein transglycosylase